MEYAPNVNIIDTNLSTEYTGAKKVDNISANILEDNTNTKKVISMFLLEEEPTIDKVKRFIHYAIVLVVLIIIFIYIVKNSTITKIEHKIDHTVDHTLDHTLDYTLESTLDPTLDPSLDSSYKILQKKIADVEENL